MDAGIATDERPFVHGEPVGIARVRFKIGRLQNAAGCGIVLDESGPVLGMTFGIVADDLPDGAVVPGDRVISRLFRRLVERNQELRLPGGRIDTDNGAQPERCNPELAVLPQSAMATASV